MTAKEYTEYWDKKIRQWAGYEQEENIVSDTSGFSETDCWNVSKIEIDFNLLPEPYWGAPQKCSCVMLNLNPGSSANSDKTDTSHFANLGNRATVCGLMAPEYSKFAKRFCLLDEEAQQEAAFRGYGGTYWWKKRVKWANRVLGLKETTDIDGNEGLRPFAIELCGWHSNRWTKSYISKRLIKKINKLTDFGKVLSEAIRNSKYKIGLAVGAVYRSALVNLGFKDITKEFKAKLPTYKFDEQKCSGSFPPLPNEKRWYKFYCDEKGATIICTWAIAYTNSEPTPAFAEFEKELLAAINNYRK